MTASRVLVRLPSTTVNAAQRHVSDAAMAITKPKTTRATTLTELGTRENKPRTNAPRTLTKRPPARARTRFHIGRRIVPYLWSPAGATCVAASSRVEPDRRPRQPRRGLHQPEHPPGVLRGAPPPRRLARRGGERAPAVRGAAPVRGSGLLVAGEGVGLGAGVAGLGRRGRLQPSTGALTATRW